MSALQTCLLLALVAAACQAFVLKKEHPPAPSLSTVKSDFVEGIKTAAHDLKESALFKKKAVTGAILTVGKAKIGAVKSIVNGKISLLKALGSAKLAKLNAIKSGKLALWNAIVGHKFGASNKDPAALPTSGTIIAFIKNKEGVSNGNAAVYPSSRDEPTIVQFETVQPGSDDVVQHSGAGNHVFIYNTLPSVAVDAVPAPEVINYSGNFATPTERPNNSE